jgi:hypothetical protein
MEPEGSLPHSQLLATCQYPELAQSSPYPHIPLPEDRKWTCPIQASNIAGTKSHGLLPLLMSYQSISPGPRLCLWMFPNKHSFSQWGVVSPSSNPQAGGPPLVGCPGLLIQYIRSYPPYCRPFLHPQPEDAPSRIDRDPLKASSFNLRYEESQTSIFFSRPASWLGDQNFWLLATRNFPFPRKPVYSKWYAICVINQHMHTTLRIYLSILYSIAPTCFDVNTSSSGSSVM